MKIALIYPKNFYASWYALGGYQEALTRLGHEVTDLPLPGNELHSLEAIQALFPPVESLHEHDVILSAYHEYTQPWLQALYGWERWEKLLARVPVIARFDESMDRTDLGLPGRVPELKKWATRWSFPAAQDAEKYAGQWLPFGADTNIFRPQGKETGVASRGDKKYDLAFIGSLYPVRQDYHQRLTESFKDELLLQLGSVCVQDLSGILGRPSTELLAENYRKIKIFFCLPPMSRLLVCKVFEVLACGTFMMFPKLPWSHKKNMDLLRDGKELVYYDPGYVAQNVQQIKFWLEHEQERERVAQAGCDRVHERHTLDQMLVSLLSLAEKSETGEEKVISFSRPAGAA